MSLSASYGRAKPLGGLELWSWVFMRVSGIVLLGLALGHWFVMHVAHSVHEIDYEFVAGRYAGWTWRLYDLALVVLAMIHGTNGTRVILDDYLSASPGYGPTRAGASRWRRAALAVLYLATGALTTLGVCVTLFFKP